MSTEQLQQMATGRGFIAALDQSGGSTPGALKRYGIETWADDAQMFELVHAMRSRIITSRVFGGDRIVGAILFDRTMESQIDGMGAAEYLWQVKHVAPFLKVDKGLLDEADGVRLMKPITDLDDALSRANGHGVFGTKMRSLVVQADKAGVAAVVDQQLELAQRILAAGLMPIVEPEVDIHSPTKGQAEDMLRSALHDGLDRLPGHARVMLKLTLPEQDGWWTPLVEHPHVLRVAALSGGYTRAEAVLRLARQPGVIASFSRALTEGLTAQQSDDEFDAVLDGSIQAIYDASLT
ncbi:Fructose-bisphosphate aldolase class 1 [Cellulomonas sp. T2.31MG-18]|uniref:fructose bisphosphate aldolase n=1 Tax=Cellulomonas sp. T2.31MG-18 TaxID=3157619 RepID=UPI0035E87D68